MREPDGSGLSHAVARDFVIALHWARAVVAAAMIDIRWRSCQICE